MSMRPLRLREPTILCAFSGDLDSLGALHKLLTEEQYASYNIHAMHVRMAFNEKREACEQIAVRNILGWYADNAYKHFTYSEAEVRLPPVGNVIARDTEITQYVMGYVAHYSDAVKHVAFGVNKHDTERSGKSWMVSNELFEAWTGRSGMKIRPVREMTKREIFDMLPTDLALLSWSCRRPIHNAAAGIATPCGVCRTCEERTRAGIPNPALSLR